MIHLSGNGVYLDTIIPSKARAWRNRADIRKWCRQYTLISAEHHERWLQRISTDDTLRMFGVFTSDCLPVGVCGLTSINQVNQSAEFSLYIAEQTARGHGREALETLIEHGFSDLNLNRIWGEVFEGNPALSMFKKVGFIEEGILRQSYFREGKFINSHIISILSGRWKSC